MLGIANRLVLAASLQKTPPVRAFIDEDGIGPGNWAGGPVLAGCDQQVAYVSYNGRVWLPGTPPRSV
ncbi:hypothetical protein [Aromatoleum petrolei]|uniref:Uncharacterized protein n=1 Tax=Aromatoleum petrolei TaxID=76116 RepID=A0ABX1MGJ3_9RHOO|nr:hypothetical protein [Aromatoleum petrolei]NMF87020.1 hypothetical protein [Aromatoleum petrolei]QTQ34755.1 Uncharacterized protein ToN1_05810 [Aromatoleum petrolei]